MTVLRQLLVQHPKGVTLAEIADHLDVTIRSARRYLDAVKSQWDLQGVPETPGGQKRWRIPSIDLPRRVALRRTQAYALLATQSLFDPMRGTALYEEIDLAAQALLGIARRPGRGPNAGTESSLERRFRYLPFAPKDYSHHADTLDAIFQCVAELQALRIRHGTTRITLQPYALLFYKDAIWLLACDVAAAMVRAFPVGELSDARALDERFLLPKAFDVDDYVQGQFGLWRSDEPPLCVVIDLDPSVAEYARSRTVHPSQRLEPLSNGGVRLSFDIADLTEVKTWVLGFGSMAKVIAPPGLRDAVKAELAKTLARY